MPRGFLWRDGAEDLEALWRGDGLEDLETGPLVVETTYADFDDLWKPLTLGVGPARLLHHVTRLKRQEALRDEVFVRLALPAGPFALSARAWAVSGVR
jgi:hypothetical protein